ncbi:hypothetical protein J6590_063783 [Homalodisca vitripennis]|nr:hypothetical protein J6590_063783 [Homalodisca vitripennis]
MLECQAVAYSVSTVDEYSVSYSPRVSGHNSRFTQISGNYHNKQSTRTLHPMSVMATGHMCSSCGALDCHNIDPQSTVTQPNSITGFTSDICSIWNDFVTDLTSGIWSYPKTVGDEEAQNELLQPRWISRDEHALRFQESVTAPDSGERFSRKQKLYVKKEDLTSILTTKLNHPTTNSNHITKPPNRQRTPNHTTKPPTKPSHLNINHPIPPNRNLLSHPPANKPPNRKHNPLTINIHPTPFNRQYIPAPNIKPPNLKYQPPDKTTQPRPHSRSHYKTANNTQQTRPLDYQHHLAE